MFLLVVTALFDQVVAPCPAGQVDSYQQLIRPQNTRLYLCTEPERAAVIIQIAGL